MKPKVELEILCYLRLLPRRPAMLTRVPSAMLFANRRASADADDRLGAALAWARELAITGNRGKKRIARGRYLRRQRRKGLLPTLDTGFNSVTRTGRISGI